MQRYNHLPQYDNVEPPPPYPGLSLNYSGQCKETGIESNTSYGTISTIVTQDDEAERTRVYDRQMNFTLCLLIGCLLLCNFVSVIFTIPATIFAWKAAKACWRRDYQSAESNKAISVTCNNIVIIQFVLVFSLFLIGIIGYIIYIS